MTINLVAPGARTRAGRVRGRPAGDSVSEWTADTALAVLLKDFKAAHLKGLEQHVAMPFNALSSTQLFDSMGQKKP